MRSLNPATNGVVPEDLRIQIKDVFHLFFHGGNGVPGLDFYNAVHMLVTDVADPYFIVVLVLFVRALVQVMWFRIKSNVEEREALIKTILHFTDGHGVGYLEKHGLIN